MPNLVENFILLFEESAPWLLLGLLIAGVMQWLVPMALLQRHVGENSLAAIIKAAFIGAPLPLCSCGVIPAAVGLRRAGASKPATVSFLIATPETGVDSISISYALLGPIMAIIRPISAILSAIYAGILVRVFIDSGEKATASATKIAENPQSGSCCSAKVQVTTPDSCCRKEKATQSEAKLSLKQKLLAVLSFSSGKLLEDITRWLLIGLVLAAVIKTWVSEDFLLQWGDGLLAMLVMALVGVPMYICATASTPLAAGFLAMGLSPGAVLVFMLAGPATNLSTIGMIRKEMGNSVVVAYLTAILSASIGIGYLTNWLVEQFHFEVFRVAAMTHTMDSSLVHVASAILLAALMVRNAVRARLKH